MADLSRYDKFLNFKGPDPVQEHFALLKMHDKFRVPEGNMESGGSLNRVSPRLAKHKRIVIAGIRAK